ncbi:MAG: flavin reductase family protein [Chloroflexota bacterium]|nr:flavin reductase family protein [Chloroflexota bacterium]
MTGTIVPRPIGWVSTIDADGQHNLAPFSFFNAICSNPPHLLFCPSIRSTDAQPKDTLHNVRATGQFVVNIVTEALAEAMNLTAAELPHDIDEFVYAGVTPSPSLTVKPPRVLESPVNYECEVTQIIEIGDHAGAGSIVIGRVLHLHVADYVMLGDDKIDITQLHPIGRLAGTGYARVTDTFALTRPESRIPKRNP